jgi:hypothetical protein
MLLRARPVGVKAAVVAEYELRPSDLLEPEFSPLFDRQVEANEFALIVISGRHDKSHRAKCRDCRLECRNDKLAIL